MAQDTTAIAIVSITAGAAVAIVGGVLNASLARRQAARQFAHERAMADRAELRVYLREVLSTLQDAVDYILGLSSDLDAIASFSREDPTEAAQTVSSRWRRRPRAPACSTERISEALAAHGQALSEQIEQLRSHMVGLGLLVGADHPLALSFHDVLTRTLVCAATAPDTFPVSAETRDEFTRTWEHLADGQRDFLEVCAQFVGVRLDEVQLSDIH